MLLADEFIELGDAASVPGPAERRALSHTRELFSGTALQHNICQSLHEDAALAPSSPQQGWQNPPRCWTERRGLPARGVQSQNGSRGRHNVSHAGRGGESPQAQMPHRDPGKTFVFCGLFFPSHLPKSVLCQMLIPGIVHHVFINCTCRATSLPIALTCKSRGHLRSTSRQLPRPRPGTSVPVRAAHPLGNRLFQNPNGQLPLLPS